MELQCSPAPHCFQHPPHCFQHLLSPTVLWMFWKVSELPLCGSEVFPLSVISHSHHSLYAIYRFIPCCPHWFCSEQERSFCLRPTFILIWPALHSVLSLDSPLMSQRTDPLFCCLSLARHSSPLSGILFPSTSFCLLKCRWVWRWAWASIGRIPSQCALWSAEQSEVSVCCLLIPGRGKVTEDTKQNQPTNQKLFQTLLVSSVCKNSGCPWQSHCQGLGPGT